MTELAATDAGRIFLVDDDEMVLQAMQRVLRKARYEVDAFQSGPEVIAALERVNGDLDLLVSDLHMPGMDGFELLGRVRSTWPDLPVVVLTGDTSPRSTVEAMRRGAYDYLTKPFDGFDEVIISVARAVERHRLVERNRVLEKQVDISDRFGGIVGSTQPMRELFRLVESVAPTDATVLLLGDSGTGKELLARAIHDRSRRRGRAFVAINCSALTDTLLESELYGHVRGAFSGASASRTGVFEEASQGTLFLDEIGDISAAMQVRLLRALQEGEIKPVGSTEIRKVDVRVVAATNKDLEAAVRAGSFRQDLYYRLHVVPIEVPPLRRRQDDVPLLVRHFLDRYCARYDRKITGVTPAALEALLAYSWPGNVRELENVVQRAVVLSSGDAIGPEHFPAAVREAAAAAGAAPAAVPAPGSGSDGDRVAVELPFAQAKQAAIDAFERRYVAAALTRAGGSVAEAARLCGLDKSNFRRLVRRHHMDVQAFRAAATAPAAPGHG